MPMTQPDFNALELAAQSNDPDSVFESLIRMLRERKQLTELFEARLMQNRHKLGMPLIQTEPLGELPEPTRRAYEDAYVAAAKEVGQLYLDDGDIVRAWPYFRAIGETGPVAAAIESIQPGEGIEPIIEIAFHERVNPRKGFELILANYGTCTAISNFEQYPSREGREECIQLLVRKLHGDLVESLKYAVAQREGATPEQTDVPTLIAGRDWLFEDNNYFVDTSHLCAVIRFSIDLQDQPTQALALELTDYGRRLSPLFHYRGQAPFEDPYSDYAEYLRALLGLNSEESIAHFRKKLSDDPETGTAPAQVLVGLLARIGRFQEAIDIALAHLSDLAPSQLSCPSIPQLCALAGDATKLRTISEHRGDLLNFAASLLA